MNVNESDPRSNVHYLGSSEKKIWTHDLCDTGAALYQLSLKSELGAGQYFGFK